MTVPAAKQAGHGEKQLPRLLIEEWLPAAAIGVECIRERSTGQQPPDKRFHVWWARRPLVASRAAVLGSLLPADFPRDAFERLLGFGRPGSELVKLRHQMDLGARVEGGFNCERAFRRALREDDLALAHEAARRVWGQQFAVIDPMAGGGSIPLESARLGFSTLANEYNPVACAVLEATVDYPFRVGPSLGAKAREWSKRWLERVESRLAGFYPAEKLAKVHAYIFARTVPCPDTPAHPPTPLVPDWHLLKPSGHRECGPSCLLAAPVVDTKRGTWTVRIARYGRGAGELRQPPRPTYSGGNGISLFSNLQIPSEYVKAQAQAGRMGNALYAIAVKTEKGLVFHPPEPSDLAALEAAERELVRLRPAWERDNGIPTEQIPEGDKTGEPMARGITAWADMFSPRQLLAMGVLVEELRKLGAEIRRAEGEEVGAAVEHLLALCLDKLADFNSCCTTWHPSRGVIGHTFQRHDYSFKSTFAEMAPCGAGSGLAWAIDNVLDAYEELAKLPRHPKAQPVEVSVGSATSLPNLDDGAITAVVVDPPYADNVQYSELADFFYVWLKRTQGHRHPEWFSSYLCEHDQEAVVNVSRHRDGKKKPGDAKREAHAFYQQLMGEVFAECRRVLRDDGVLTVMFTHKQQSAWVALFTSLVAAGFTISATWPIKTESQHSLHQARKNAAQSTVVLVARKRPAGAGTGYFDEGMAEEIRRKVRAKATQLQKDGLNPVDQLVGSFGAAMQVYSRYSEVRTDTGEPVGVERAIEEASNAVSAWRIERLAQRGLQGVEPEGRFSLLCWDVLGAAEFRFNEANLLGRAVGMSVDQVVAAGLIEKAGENVRLLSAQERKREQALQPEEVHETLFGPVSVGRRATKAQALKVHPNDPAFRTALDGCHALALRFIEAGGGAGGVGTAKALALQQSWKADSAVARLMEALVRAAPEGVRFPEDKRSAAAKYPEFVAWHRLLKELFGIEPPAWERPAAPVGLFDQLQDAESEDEKAKRGGEDQAE